MTCTDCGAPVDEVVNWHGRCFQCNMYPDEVRDEADDAAGGFEQRVAIRYLRGHRAALVAKIAEIDAEITLLASNAQSAV